MQPTPLVLLADDLTGASDAAFYFAATGARTTVCLDRMPAHADADVTVIDLCSRLLAPSDARDCVREALASVPQHARLAKKIDSTLRGNIESEIAALLEARPDAIALVVPAYPGAGRTQRGGTLFVHGTPVHESDFGSDLFAPVRSSSIVEYLPSGEATVIQAASAGGGPAGLRDAVRIAIANGARAIAFDAENDADLDAIATLADDGRFLWVGSAGMFAPLASRLCAADRPADAAIARAASAPTLFVIGSLSEMTRQQIAHLAATGAAVEIVDPRTILIDESRKRSSVIAERIGEALAAGRDTLVALPSDRSDIEAALSMGRIHGFDVATTSRELRERLIELIVPFLDRVGALVLSGGDVGRSFCTLRGISEFSLVGEAAPAIAACRAADTPTLVFKGGGAGRPDTYSQIARGLRAGAAAR